jgi:2-polyprenyl-3-methyl-5-hydroxy-6-metoxy-1,4-benzoquinol methylase
VQLVPASDRGGTFSERHRATYYDEPGRRLKADKILAVLREELGDLSSLSVVDLGCSTGFVAGRLSEHVGDVIGVDLDQHAIAFAQERLASRNLSFRLGDAMDTGLPDASVDVVVCAQVYEHVSDPGRLMHEIHRILRPGGACFFSATNRLVFIDVEHGLPLLSWLPPRLARAYARLAAPQEVCDAQFRTYWGLRRLVAPFVVHDYTARVIADPDRYSATDVVRPGSFVQRAAALIARRVRWLCPGYIWVLRRPTVPQTRVGSTALGT